MRDAMLVVEGLGELGCQSGGEFGVPIWRGVTANSRGARCTRVLGEGEGRRFVSLWERNIGNLWLLANTRVMLML